MSLYKLALSASFEYLWYGSTAIRYILILKICGEFNVHSRQILTYKDGPKGKKGNVLKFEIVEY